MSDPSSPAAGSDLALLRHTLATLAYRGAKPLRGAPPDFAAFRAGDGSRSAGEIVAHLGDLMEWGASMARGQQRWPAPRPADWSTDVARFFAELERFDAVLAGAEPFRGVPSNLFQSAIADSLTHVGQLTMLRRLAGAPIRGENYGKAEIVAGRCGPDQTSARAEFD